MSANTVESYARDLAALAGFAESKGRDVSALDRRDLEAFVRSLMASGLSPRSVGPRRRLHPRLLPVRAVEQKLDSSPADDLRAPRAWPALPKYLDLDEVDRLLAQPDVVDAAQDCATRRSSRCSMPPACVSRSCCR